MSKKLCLILTNLCAFALTIFIIYYLLLNENSLHISIASIISYAHTCSINGHLLILGLLPVYIALIVFGLSTAGYYFATFLQNLVIRSIKPPTLRY